MSDSIYRSGVWEHIQFPADVIQTFTLFSHQEVSKEQEWAEVFHVCFH